MEDDTAVSAVVRIRAYARHTDTMRMTDAPLVWRLDSRLASGMSNHAPVVKSNTGGICLMVKQKIIDDIEMNLINDLEKRAIDRMIASHEWRHVMSYLNDYELTQLKALYKKRGIPI